MGYSVKNSVTVAGGRVKDMERDKRLWTSANIFRISFSAATIILALGVMFSSFIYFENYNKVQSKCFISDPGKFMGRTSLKDGAVATTYVKGEKVIVKVSVHGDEATLQNTKTGSKICTVKL